MKLKLLKRLGVGLLATTLVIGSFAVWAYFTQRSINAKEQEILDRRYPVKAGKPKPKPTLAPLPVREALPLREPAPAPLGSS